MLILLSDICTLTNVMLSVKGQQEMIDLNAVPVLREPCEIFCGRFRNRHKKSVRTDHCRIILPGILLLKRGLYCCLQKFMN